jgi:hypothetical protein
VNPGYTGVVHATEIVPVLVAEVITAVGADGTALMLVPQLPTLVLGKLLAAPGHTIRTIPPPPPSVFELVVTLELKDIVPDAVNIYVLYPPDETYVAVVVAATYISG